MTLSKCESIEPNKYELEFSVEAETFLNALQKAFNQEKKSISVPGFRKGKAPRGVVEKLYGEGVFFERAVNNILNEILPDVIDEAGLTLITRPDVEVLNVSKEDGVSYKAVCFTYPEVKVGDYKGITVTKTVYTFSDDDVKAKLDALCKKGARAVSIDTPAEIGNDVVMDFAGSVDGVPFDGGSGEDFDLRLGSGQFIAGFEDALVGHSAGEEFDIDVTFPTDYHIADLAGKPAVFHINLKDVTVEELPELNDELVSDYSEFKTVDEFRADCVKQLTEQTENRNNADIENKIFRSLIEMTEAEIPQLMIDQKIDKQVSEYESRLMSQGLNLETYLQYTGTDLETFRASYAPRAKDEVTLRLALVKIAELEELEVSEEEIEAGIAGLAAQYGMTVNKVKSLIPYDSYREDLLVGKASEIVKQNATVNEPEEAAEAPATEEAE